MQYRWLLEEACHDRREYACWRGELSCNLVDEETARPELVKSIVVRGYLADGGNALLYAASLADTARLLRRHVYPHLIPAKVNGYSVSILRTLGYRATALIFGASEDQEHDS